MATNIKWVLDNNSAYEGCSWFMVGDTNNLDNLNWGSTKGVEDNAIAKPTQSELDEYFNANKTAYDNSVSVSKRKYPSIQDQLDDIYHNGIDGWKTTIKAIKDANPKA